MGVAWVTGARGFIGSRLARALQARDLTVCGVGHGQLPLELRQQTGLAAWLNAEVAPEALGRLAQDFGMPELVFHLAGGATVGASLLTPLEDFMRTTVTTARLLEWLRTHAPAAQLVVASSAAVYGDTGGTPAQESRAPAPVSPYGHHKLMMEQLCREYAAVFGLRTAVARLFSVYGEGLRKQLLWDCATKLSAAQGPIELGGTGEELRDWIHVDDAADLLQRVAARADNTCPIYNGGSGSGVTVREVVDLLAAALHSSQGIRYNGRRRAGDPAVLVADVTRSHDIGHNCSVSLPDGVRRYADWFAQVRTR